MPHYDLSDIKKFNNNITKATKALEQKKENFIIFVFSKNCYHCHNMMTDWVNFTKTKGKGYSSIRIENEMFRHMQSSHSEHPLVRYTGEISGYPHIIKTNLSSNETSQFDDKFDQRTTKNLALFASS